jgi:hypothetical protein
LAIAAIPSGGDTAESVLKEYLKLAGPSKRSTGPDLGHGRVTRLDVLLRLSGTSNCLATVRDALPSLTNDLARAELAEMLGRNIQTRESAAVLSKLLKDRDEGVRGAALHGLRLMAARIDRGGRVGVQAEPAHDPKVSGLVPILIPMADDPASIIRISALYALADTREPDAIAEIRKHLRDQDEKVRLTAACLLTEVHDASGLPELRAALTRLHSPGARQQHLFFYEAEPLLLALGRITGQSFGEVPMNPTVSSNFDQMKELVDEYYRLIDAWAKWAEQTQRK